jgi:hypothetical protein
MSYVPHLVFASPHIENQFRRAVTCDDEVGGWLLYNRESSPGWDACAFRRLTGSVACFVRGFIIAPNCSQSPRVSWGAWDWQKAQDLARETARAQDLGSLPFHTHPNGYLEPSLDDIAFYVRLDNTSAIWFAVASHSPLRVIAYSIPAHTCATGESALVQARFTPWARIRRRAVWQ